jgi:hypothetical protein
VSREHIWAVNLTRKAAPPRGSRRRLGRAGAQEGRPSGPAGKNASSAAALAGGERARSNNAASAFGQDVVETQLGWLGDRSEYPDPPRMATRRNHPLGRVLPSRHQIMCGHVAA